MIWFLLIFIITSRGVAIDKLPMINKESCIEAIAVIKEKYPDPEGGWAATVNCFCIPSEKIK